MKKTAVESQFPNILKDATAAATSHAKACNNFWKFSALIIFVGLAGFSREDGAGNLLGTSMARNEYSIYGSLMLLLLITPFTNAYIRYIIIKATIDARLSADTAYEIEIVTRKEVKDYSGSELSESHLVAMMSLGDIISSLSEMPYSNFSATNRGIRGVEIPWLSNRIRRFYKYNEKCILRYRQKLQKLRYWDEFRSSKCILFIIKCTKRLKNIRKINWQISLIWYICLPIWGALVLRLRACDVPWWYGFAVVAAMLIAAKPLVAVIRLHHLVGLTLPAKERIGV